MAAIDDAYNELHACTMARGGEAFILQHVVDAFAAQTADENTKPIKITFALLGLYLHIEQGFSGRQVQRVHMKLGERKRQWPVISLPVDRGSMTVFDVLAVPEGTDRDRAIDQWCRSVWTAFHDSRQTIIELLRDHQII
jgi:hypothetical protein